MKFTLKQLEKKSKSRPQGYFDDVINNSKNIGNNLYELSDENFNKIAEKYKLPKKVEMIKSATKEMVNIFQDKIKKRSEENQIKILEICSKCEKYIAASNRCGQCGCFLNAKVKFTSSTCPLKKW